ncbi:hypothetical protein CEUSTIGMA_g10701.t1 [Chlamydomonas eustigma]|uniref:Protein kinase domain-containing protein n=1 Tax=Chlamydomonas eustigma TaxID=1157962 RepID=A0A250XJL2_9CHLO|nr:hypothetical protein CEUSTIGMA_g10701.t1 [Chlamydomonas eustigma]|eukprot:GAX83275.1 hypothetical protein CEUSTIGMA_g10701.t1 [Chlamydomonas eustigma]
MNLSNTSHVSGVSRGDSSKSSSLTFEHPRLQFYLETIKSHKRPWTRAHASDVSGSKQASASFISSKVNLIKVVNAKKGDDWFFNEAGQKGWVEAMELTTLSPEMPSLLKEMGVKYDPDRLAAVLSSNWPQVYSRALYISTSLGGFITKVAADVALGTVDKNLSLRAKELRNVLGALGPSFVKIGQALSSRPDLLPREYLETLSSLQDRLPAFSTDIAFAVIEEELGRPIGDVFVEISERPVAAASLGQVYKGLLHTGESVAIKVQRPSIGESIAVDMLLLRRLMGVVDRNVPQISQPLVPLVDEFAARLFSELDYIMEGHSCEKFQQLYGDVPRVRTPKIYWQATSRRVLCMEWIEGVKLTDKESMAAAGLSVVDFVNVGVECSLRQLLDYGYFHADPHPGNLLATVGGDLVYLDFGMMSEAPQYARYAIIEHVVHLVNRDYEAMCRDYYTLEFMDRSVDTSPIAPALAEFFDDVLDQSVSNLNFKSIVDGLGEVLFRFPFKVPPYYALILRSLTVLEGLALQADSKYKLLGRAYPYMASRLLTDPAPELRTSFEELIIKDGTFRWNRLENLMKEGSKSQFFDPTQLWLLGEWLLSSGASSVRTLIVSEVARMIDAWAAGTVRQDLSGRTGSPQLAELLVPLQPKEEEARSRARVLLSALAARLPAAAASAPSASTSFASSRGGAADGSIDISTSSSLSSGSGGAFDGLSLISFRGTGPLGLLTPGDVMNVMNQLRAAALKLWPRLEGLMRQPGAQELVNNLSSQLTARFAARAIKFVFGAVSAQQLLLAPRRDEAGPANATAAAATRPDLISP